MKKRNLPRPSLPCLICCLALLLAGCVGVAPPAPDVSPGQRVLVHIPETAHPILSRVDLPERHVPRTLDLTDAPDDLFERIRQGFSMPDLVDELVGRRQQWYLERPEHLRRMIDRSRLYLHHIVEEIDKRGMPMELALLPMVESAYNPMAYSRARASGLWQFIPSTGKHYNLGQDWWKDERRDIVASTAAALDYLQLVYETHGDWHLALASYNWGAGAVGRAIEKNRAKELPTDYLSLAMPDETRNYVPKLQALKNIFSDPGLMAELELPSIPNRPYFATYTTDSHIDVALAAELAEMPVEEFLALNPAHNRPVILPDTPLVIPAEKMETFVANLEAHGSENKPLSAWRTYTLRPGDRLESIAPRFGMTVARLRAVNGIQGRLPLSPGLTLLVLGKEASGDAAALPARSSDRTWPESVSGGIHVVARGETLAGIARRHGVSVAELRKINGLRSDRIVIGERLRLSAADAGPRAGGVPPVRKTVETSSKTTRYVVRRGDTIYSIARQFKVAAEDLMRRNRVTPQTLKSGATLNIRE